MVVFTVAELLISSIGAVVVVREDYQGGMASVDILVGGMLHNVLLVVVGGSLCFGSGGFEHFS